MTGGGFGGAVVIAAAAGTGREVARRVAGAYRYAGGQPRFSFPRHSWRFRAQFLE